jgi:Short C-terminal domain
VNLRTVAGLLALWCVLVVGPGLLVVAIFTGAADDTPVFAWAIAIWVAGYLAQLVVFMMLARKSKGNSIVGWLIASLAPWAADWSAPAVAWAPLLVLFIVVPYAFWFYRGLAGSSDLQQHGIPATGTVLDVEDPLMNTVINGVYIRRTMRLRIDRTDGTPPYEAKYSGTFMLGEIPGVGDVFALRVDPKDPHHFETTDGAQSGPPPTALSSNWTPDVSDQLQRLADLHGRGDLTDEEFATAKARLLSGQ